MSAQPSPTAITERIRSSANRPIDFHAAVFPDTVFEGQQVTYQVAVLLSDEARARLRRNPEFLPPELRGLLAYELGTPTRVAPRNYGGRFTYEAHVFQRALFPVSAGTVRVPAPQLTYSLPQSASYFSREERFVVRAESAQLVVKPLPLDDRPEDFIGAVGVLRASARFDASAATVGNPLVLTVRIEGTGNVRLLPRPVLELSWATVVPGTERVQVDTSGALVRGAKEFEFLLTPTRDGPAVVPAIRYPYFDPYKRQYLVAETLPADVRVAPGDLAAPAPEEIGEQTPLRPWAHRSTRTPADWSRAIWLALLAVLGLAPLPAMIVRLKRPARRRAEAERDRPSEALRPNVPVDSSPGGVARRTRRELIEQMAARLHVSPAEMVTRRDFERVLRRRGVTRATTLDVLQFLDDLAVQGFGGAGARDASRVTASPDLRASALFQRVSAEAVSHGRTRLWARRLRPGRTLLVLVSAITFASAVSTSLRAQSATPSPGPAGASSSLACRSAAAQAGAATAVTATPLDLLVGEAMAAYSARRFASAAQRFAAAAAACPRDVSLLVNWGTAAWAAADTVHAVVAWQRAARLDPLAADVQRLLALLPAGARGGFADVPMVPVTTLVLVGVVAWCLAWLVLWMAWRRATPPPALAATGALLVLLAIGAGATAWWGHRALDADFLHVVGRPETLRAAPGFDAPTAGGVATGDVVRVTSEQEGWSRVMLADERTGWIPASRLTPLLDTSRPR
ncbi:hypothetical protein MASR1M101_05950 [Gemmatimonas sp.]